MIKIHSISLTVILVLLVLAIPFIGQYEPFFEPSETSLSIWEIDIREDPYFNFRLSVIVLGMLITVVSFFIVVIETVVEEDPLLRYFNFILFLLIFSVAWKDYPFWANGFLYKNPGYAYDVKAILPVAYIGEVWRMPILLVMLLIWLLNFFLAYQLVKSFSWSKTYIKKAALLVGSQLVLLWYFHHDKQYFTWFFD